MQDSTDGDGDRRLLISTPAVEQSFKKKKQSNNRSRLDGQRKERMRPRGGRGADVTLRGPSPLNPVFFLKQMPIPGS